MILRLFFTFGLAFSLVASTWSQSPFIWKRNVPGSPQAVVFSPDGDMIYVGSSDKSIQVYRATDGSLVRQISNLPGPVGVLDVSPDGTLLASSSFIFEGSPSGDPNVRVWRTSDLSPVAVLPGQASDVMDVDFSPDGKRLLSYDLDGVVRLYLTADWSLEKQVATGTMGIRARFIGTGQTAVSIDFFGELRVYAIPNLNTLRSGQAGISSFLGAFAVAPDGHSAVAEAFNSISWINLDTLGRSVANSEVMQGYDADYSFDGINMLMTGLPFTSADDALERWYAPSHKKLTGYSLSGLNQVSEGLGVRHRPGHPRQFAVGIGSVSFGSSSLALGLYPKALVTIPGVRK